MALEIRRLTQDELGPLLDFMDGPAFKSQPQWRGCYCQFYLNTEAENNDPQAKPPPHVNGSIPDGKVPVFCIPLSEYFN